MKVETEELLTNLRNGIREKLVEELEAMNQPFPSSYSELFYLLGSAYFIQEMLKNKPYRY